MYINNLSDAEYQPQNFDFNVSRPQIEQGRIIHFMGWKMLCDRFEVHDPSGNLVPFTTGEFLLLRSFAYSPGRVLTRDQLFNLTRGEDYKAFDRAIDIQIGRLRRKLGDDWHNPRFIKTIRDIGYMFIPQTTYENFN